MRRLARRCRVYLRAARIARLEPVPVMVIETIESSPSRAPRRRTRAELDREFEVYEAAGFPRPDFLYLGYRPRPHR